MLRLCVIALLCAMPILCGFGFSSGSSAARIDGSTLVRNSAGRIEAVNDQTLMLQQAKQAKGGVVGTNGKAAISLRFDDYHDFFKANIFALLTARGLPAGYAHISRGSDAGQWWWSATTTWDDIRLWANYGIEVWSHGSDHRDYSLDGYAGLYREVVGSKQQLEAQGLKVQGFMLPGVIPFLTPVTPYANGLTKMSDYYSEAGRLIMATYPLSQTYALGSYRQLSPALYHGHSNYTTSEGSTLANILSIIDRAIAMKWGVGLMTHPYNLGRPGNMTLAEFVTLLDYIVTKRDAGVLEVLTPSSMSFADLNSNFRLDLINTGGFEGLTAVGDKAGEWEGLTSSGVSFLTDSGRTGTQSVRIAGVGTVRQYPPYLKELGIQGEVFVFEGWCRAATGTTNSRVIIKDSHDTSKLNLDLSVSGITTEWKKITHAFSIPPSTTRLTIAVGRMTTGTIEWDDLSVKKY